MVSSFKQFIYFKKCMSVFIIFDASLESVCLGGDGWGSSQQADGKTGSLVLREILCTVHYIGATGKYNFGSNGFCLYVINFGNGL
jgi:hypothetical protein